ncbi:MAG: hypothetical protein NDJ72_07735, partial [Elusimicrobia bacterium]|nr:hypothetical protein [Elusimicrobiota bacterium]
MKPIEERLEDGMREIGILLVAFAPLDISLNHREGENLVFLALFFGLGMTTFLGALVIERHRFREAIGKRLLIFLGIGLCLFV